MTHKHGDGDEWGPSNLLNIRERRLRWGDSHTQNSCHVEYLIEDIKFLLKILDNNKVISYNEWDTIGGH